MEIEETGIKDLLIIKAKVFFDDRGYFLETYNKSVYEEKGLNFEFLQDNLSMSNKNVLRGLHLQDPPYEQGKLVRVLKGAVYDVVVDIRKQSPTYGTHFKVELNQDNNLALWIPAGFAHGFVSLVDGTLFQYKCTNVYNKASERAILWNDPQLGIDWGVENPIISEKDQEASLFSDFVSSF